LVGVFEISEGKMQNKLTTAILIQSAVCVYALFKAARFFEPSDSVDNLKYESKRLLDGVKGQTFNINIYSRSYSG
jgi:hypothetical protein